MTEREHLPEPFMASTTQWAWAQPPLPPSSLGLTILTPGSIVSPHSEHLEEPNLQGLQAVLVVKGMQVLQSTQVL